MDNNLNYTFLKIQAAIALTTSYVVATTVLKANQKDIEGNAIPQITDNNQLVLLVNATLGSLTSIEIQFECSPDGVTWYPETVATVTLTTQTVGTPPYVIGASGNYRIPIQLKDNQVRIKFKGTGTVTGSSITLGAVVGTA